MRAYAVSDIGLKRQRNEDSFLIDKTLGVFAVCDGMGGHKGGDVASQMAIAVLKETLQNSDATEDILTDAIEKANLDIYKKAMIEPNLYEMGTTMTVAKIEGYHLSVRHVGDSALFLVRERQVTKLTHDHTFGAMILENKDNDNLSDFGLYQHVLTRAVGIKPEVEVEASEYELISEDILILCSDGLTDHVKPAEFANIYNTVEHLSEYPHELVSLALQRGGSDNVTVIVIGID